ncbi:hypothetical protein C8R45DRAFT_1075429 [Mycena sanguinolenta]|nr:hypothetical protein C8R45DRAFT_1075429 [Mycena sanguinolenta]
MATTRNKIPTVWNPKGRQWLRISKFGGNQLLLIGCIVVPRSLEPRQLYALSSHSTTVTMHPALALDNLKRLPSNLRLAANAAISPNRSVADLRVVKRHLATATEKQFIWMLPVFYINLDPTAIPDLDGFDTKAPSSDAVSVIGRAFMSLEEVSVMRFPESVGVYLWLRVWPWARFIHMYRDHLPGITPPRDDTFCRGFLSFTVALTHHRDTHRRIVATPWFWYLFGRAWTYLPAIKDPSKQEMAAKDIAFFLIEEGITKPSNLDEFVSGAGGTLTDVAHLVISFTDCVLPKRGAALDDTQIHFLGFILIFVCFLDPALGHGTQPTENLGQFGKALLERDFISVLIEAICSLSKSTIKEALHPMQKTGGSGNRASNTGWSHLADDLDHQYFVRLLRPSLVNRHSLSALGRALQKTSNLVNTTAFRQCGSYKLWAEFFSVARERVEVLAAFDSNLGVRNVACDNLQCGKIGVKAEFRRCSVCQSMYYCSQACQNMDWRHGGHRETCDSHGKLLLSAKNSLDSTARQRAFLRALVHRDYLLVRRRLISDQIKFMKAHPDGAFVTMFDYTQGAVRIRVEPRTVLEPIEGFSGVEWKSIVSREAASGGRMEIHVVGTSALKSRQWFVIPLRTSNPFVHDRVHDRAHSWSDSDLVILWEQLRPRMDVH